ncbi:MAG: glycosyltransferase [Methanoregula sp.]|nr:glycosyltransferase [Methanoregula sp.]
MADPVAPPLASIILRAYNSEKHIAEAIDSILAQTCPDFELIIVDDGSTDATAKIIAGYTDPRIVCKSHTSNCGASRASNTGVLASRGTYIGFIDSDDTWLPEKLEEMVRCFSSLPREYGVVYSDMWEIDPQGTRKYWHSPEMDGYGLINQEIADYRVSWLGNGAVLIKKECFDTLGLYDEEFRCFEDSDFFMRISQKYRFFHIRKPLYVYRTWQGITSNSYEVCIARLLLLKKYPQTALDEKFLEHQCDLLIQSIRTIRDQNRIPSEIPPVIPPEICPGILPEIPPEIPLVRKVTVRLFPPGTWRGKTCRRVLDRIMTLLNPHLHR